MTQPSDTLDLFSPSIAEWFRERMGEPTEVQHLAWPRIAAGEHVLVTAPTGSGKTLAAFLWALDRLFTKQWDTGNVRVLYISPLRALGNDIRRNLLEPLEELPERFAAKGLQVPEIRVLTRTGDTPQSERRQILKSPPEILITTPESLNNLLTSVNGRKLLVDLETVILDEVHAVIASKRGTHLMTAVERLVPLCGELQRIALSATVRPLDEVARWVGGYRLEGSRGEAVFRPREVAIVDSRAGKRYELDVDLPVAEAGASRDPDSLWTELTAKLKRTINRNRSTLIFGNSKRTVEKVARFLNEEQQTQLAYSHHGALSREIRSVVEERLKSGTLKAIVATNSLELGIDIGSIDEVALIQPPPTVASALQRLGRSGHGVGQDSRGSLYPLHAYGLIESAVIARCVADGDIEAMEPISNPLDVLAQVLLSMTVARVWNLDELYDAIRTSEAYRNLPRSHFDLVIEMLSGRYASTRVRGLRPLLSVDGIDGSVRARPGAERLLYLSGGTIPDRGYFNLRIDGSGSPLGQLDEEFVWERAVGDTFTLGVQTWRIRRITHNDVFVSQADARSAMAPFWRAEERDRSSFLSERIGLFLEAALAHLDDDGFLDELSKRYKLQPGAASELQRLLREQRASTDTLPHRHQVVVEHTVPPGGRGNYRQMVLHTVWGGRVNRPFAYALTASWRDQYGVRPEIVHGDDCIIVSCQGHELPDDPFAMVSVDRIDELLRSSLEHTGFFGARFREAAGRALLLPRGGHRKRTPLWLNRQRAKEMLEAVSSHQDFPLVLETWRSCLQDEFELEVLRHRLEEIQDGRVAVRHVHTERPSPFTDQVTWKQTNRLMYEDDRPLGGESKRISPDLVHELVFASHLRPKIPIHIADELQAKLHRTTAGYAPRSGPDLLDWIKERILVPVGEWQQLCDRMERDHAIDMRDELAPVADRLLGCQLGDQDGPSWICAIEALPRIIEALGIDADQLRFSSTTPGRAPSEAARSALATVVRRWADAQHDASLAEFLEEWLAFYGPVTPGWIATTLGQDPAEIASAVDGLAKAQTVIADQILNDSAETEVCDRQNLERLLRMTRAAAKPSFKAVGIDYLPLFLAHHQGLASSDATLEDLKSRLEPLFGWPAPVELIETEILPARLDPYLPAWFDTLLSETDLQWFGSGRRRIAVCLAGDRNLFRQLPGATEEEAKPELDEVFPQSFGRYSFMDLLRSTSWDSSSLAERLWRLAWDGAVSTDSFAPVRHGISSDFRPESVAVTADGGRRRRPRFDRWRSERPTTGSWFRLTPNLPSPDALAEEEDTRERARVLLDRYGVVFRELTERELPALRWSAVFRALRMLELAGEVVVGRFFEGTQGIQFMSRHAFRQLEEGIAEDRVWWVNAADPASPCGLGPLPFANDLPRRVPSNHLVFHGLSLVVVSERRSASLTIKVEPDHPKLPEYLEFIRVQLARAVKPRRFVTVETINQDAAASSPFRGALQEFLHVTRTPTGLRLSRRY